MGTSPISAHACRLMAFIIKTFTVTIMTHTFLALVLVLFYTYDVGSGVKVAIFRFNVNVNVVRSSQVRNAIAEIARKNDIILVQGVQDKWASHLLQMLNSKSSDYSLALATVGQGNCSTKSAQKQRHEFAYFYQTGNVRLLNMYCYKPDDDAHAISSVLVKDLQNGLPEFFILINSDDSLEVSHLTGAINATVATFGTDKGIIIKSECSTSLSKDFELVPQRLDGYYTFNRATDKPCAWTPDSIVASKSLLQETVVTPLKIIQQAIGLGTNYNLSSLEFFITIHSHNRKATERGQISYRSSGSSPGVFQSSSGAKTAGAAAGAAVGCIAIFITILGVICCCIDRRCGYSRIR